MRRKIAAVLIGLSMLVGPAACGSNDSDQGSYSTQDDGEDCDREDAYNLEGDCGYYSDTGVWVWYPWVTPWIGGVPPHGTHPTVPKGVKPKVPATRPKPPASIPRPAPKPVAPQQKQQPAYKQPAPAYKAPPPPAYKPPPAPAYKPPPPPPPRK